MGEEELRTALTKFADYLLANGVSVDVGLFAGRTIDRRYTMTIGTPAQILDEMATLVLIDKGCSIKRPNV